ncbi:hypothetical protein A2774_03385 [Candidatus Roizmanbacteria bacterium RIFCSPHIGHO2_01_FULL_39_12c]|uniref:Uncharacterized protein n=1 Tax=Candidatus Roizmanbacteria bacterium RIFCSPHIGHO2_01_FULL_39_12c TaxID=1802031 RepID=A0A1F7G8Y0_9BACT|nr:MAG: hypothetical protein A2774_03385 [Candidatus Roizmanbacteria bacterium RIFCSPHIGHO2_01_FULL_39_12c]
MLSYYLKVIKKILGLAKKVLLVIVVFASIITLFSYFINKDKQKLHQSNFDPVKQNRKAIYEVIKDPELNKTREGKLAITVYRSLMCVTVGESCTDNPNDGDTRFQSSVFGYMSNLLTLPFSKPPASGVSWVYNGLADSGLVPKVRAAQGIGFAAISPLQPIWKIFRDATYVLLVLILVAIGFMIMFRMKINPQTVISIESALPRIIVALLLITFSFPIAGFMIDLMYVVMALTISILVPASAVQLDLAAIQNMYLTATPGVLIDELFPINENIIINTPLGSLLGGTGPIAEMIKSNGLVQMWTYIVGLTSIGYNFYAILPRILQTIFLLLSGVGAYIASNHVVKSLSTGGGLYAMLEDINIQAATFGLGVGGIISSFFGTITFIVLFVVIVMFFGVPLLIGLLVWFTILFLFFRIFFLLLSTYIKIVLFIIFSPLLLLFQAIPGRNAFGFWFRNLFGEILTFPLIATIILTGNIMISNISLVPSQVNVGPVTTYGKVYWAPPFLYGLNQTAFSFLIGLGIILLIPDLVKLVKELMGVKPLPISIGLGTYFGGAGAAVGGGLGLAGQYGSLAIAFPGLRTFGEKLGGKIGLGGLFRNPEGGGSR